MFKLFHDPDDSPRANDGFMRMNFCMVMILLIVGVSIARKVLLTTGDSLRHSKISTRNEQKPSDKCEILFGILTIPNNREMREWARSHWISLLPHNACHMFLFDNTEDIPLDEKGDAFVLESKHRGRAIRFGEKLYNYFSKAARSFPNVKYFIKMDDDAVICTHRLFQQFNSSPLDERTYLGWFHNLSPAGDGFHDGLKYVGCNRLTDENCNRLGDQRQATQLTRSDEFFVLLGRGVVEELIAKPYCGTDQIEWCESHGQWYDTNFGGTSLAIWISHLENVHALVMNNLFQFDKEKSTKRGPDMIVYHPRKTVVEANTAWQMCETPSWKFDNAQWLFYCNLGKCVNYVTTLDFLNS